MLDTFDFKTQADASGAQAGSDDAMDIILRGKGDSVGDVSPIDILPVINRLPSRAEGDEVEPILMVISNQDFYDI